MQYRSFADLSDVVVRCLHLVPTDIDLVVGIPRSGLMAASLIALNLNLPLQDLDSFIAGVSPTVGRTVRVTMAFDPTRKPKRVLIVDDTIDSGQSLRDVRRRIDATNLGCSYTYLAVYGSERNHEEADIVMERVGTPRIFEWNVMRHRRLTNACLDIDGVLCHDPEQHENDDGLLYSQFLLDARRMRIPSVKVRYLVTSRLERYRAETEAWMERHGIEYGELVMLDVATAEERRRLGVHGRFKGEFYASSDAELFIESEDRQALEIAQLSNKPVLSIEGQRIVVRGSQPLGTASGAMRHPPDRGRSLFVRGRRLAGRTLRKLGLRSARRN